jgi:hypothetical protein
MVLDHKSHSTKKGKTASVHVSHYLRTWTLTDDGCRRGIWAQFGCRRNDRLTLEEDGEGIAVVIAIASMST